MTVFFTSDLHIGHAFVASLRYDTIMNQIELDMGRQMRVNAEITKWHDDLLAQYWDAFVKPDDVVWILGDISAGGTAAQMDALQWIDERNGTKHLISGNHDGVHPMHRNAHKFHKPYSLHFESVAPVATRKIALPDGSSQRVLLSHFPYSGDHTPGDRYGQYRLRDEGLALLHGHVHTNQQLGKSDLGTLQIHVGIDAWDYHPVALEEIVEVLDR